MNCYKLIVAAALAATTIAEVPIQCITDTNEEFAGVTRGNTVEVNDSVADIADPSTRFFGIRSCVDKESGRMVSIQFYLRKDGESELLAMPQVGPTLPEELITCVRRKLEQEDYHIDKVTIYESPGGVDAFKFSVGQLSETFGTPTEESIETVVNFTGSD